MTGFQHWKFGGLKARNVIAEGPGTDGDNIKPALKGRNVQRVMRHTAAIGVG